MSKITPCLWFKTPADAEEAVPLYVSLLPDSRIDHVFRSPVDTHSGPAGSVLTIDFTLAGQPYLALIGGGQTTFNDSVSFQIHCDNQQEVDRLWDALTAQGGKGIACSWLHDRWGLRWQIVPKRLTQLIKDKDPKIAKRAMEAMMGMVKIDIAQLEKAVKEG